MFRIVTTYTTTAKGAGRVVAKGHGRQRTMPYDPEQSVTKNHAWATGILLDTMLTDEQRAKMRHPSAAQRVTMDYSGDKRVWTVNV